MDQVVKQKWVAALRSGDYKQGQQRLRSNDNYYCCLGVLCDIHAKETGGKWDAVYGMNPMYGGSSVAVNQYIRDWADMSQDEHSQCVTLNDLYGNTFNQIADHVEKQF